MNEPHISNLNEDKLIDYIGFWKRFAATVADSVLWVLITAPLLIGLYGVDYYQSEEAIKGSWDLLINHVLPVVLSVYLWLRFAATPGKMLFHAVIVDANTLKPITWQQAVIRYFGYIPSILVLGLGFIWVAFDERKQGWHDKLAHTVVIRKEKV